MFYEKQETYKIIKELTYYIGNTGFEMSQNRNETDLIAFTYNDAKYIRKEMQVNNEELYNLYTYFLLYDKEISKLEYYINKLEAIAQTKGLYTKRGIFRQEDIFISSLPLMINKESVKNAARRNVLSKDLIATYPFITNNIYDEDGIYIADNRYDKTPLFINRYNQYKYKNSNMCIFGTSGSGKSFYTKILILRSRLSGLEQYIIDPEREYENVIKSINGSVLKIGPTSDTYLNVLDIRKNSIEDKKGFLATKIQNLMGFFKLVYTDINDEEKSFLEEAIIKCYKQKGITFEDKSLYEKNIFKGPKDMPLLEDLYKILESDKKTKKLSVQLFSFVKGSLRYFNNYTNIEIKNKTVLADVYELGEENLKYGMYIFTELFWDLIKEKRNSKKVIYLDEAWRLIGITANKEVAQFIYKIFKTIRKYGGSAVAITQDVSDLFSLDNGVYGKSILNNSSIKTFFALEEENIKILSENINITEKEKFEIKSLKRGECLMFIGESHILSKIEAADYEKNIIEGGVK